MTNEVMRSRARDRPPRHVLGGAGDAAIRTAGAVLAAAVRDLDVVARVGGDEFALLLPGLGQSACHAVVRRIEALTAEATPAGPAPLRLRLGRATATAGDQIDGAMAEADRMLRAAKLHSGDAGAGQPT